MSLLNANVARFFFQTSELPPEVFEVSRFTGVEGISQPFRFTLDLVSQDPAIDFNAVVGRPASFTMMRGEEPLSYHGEVAHFQQLGRIKNHAAYRVVLVPGMERLRYGFVGGHIFQRRTVQQILQEVIVERGLVDDVQFVLNGTYEPREYCVQFQESYLAFAQRLMEHEGIYYYFKHSDSSSRLVITDDHTTLESIPGEATIVYDEGEGMVPEGVETVQHFVCHERYDVPGFVEIADYNYERPDDAYLLSTASPPPGASDMGSRGYRYEYGGNLKTYDEADRLVKVRMAEFESTRLQATGESNCPGLRSGFLYTMERHYRPDFNADYLLVEVHHTGSQRQAMGLQAEVDEQTDSGIFYRNTFRCRPASVPYCPPRVTPVPRVPGLMVAHVDHPDRIHEDHRHVDDYAYLDDQGRYRATINFDGHREQPPGDHSLPIPMVQPYSGPNYGMHFPNHGGTEMLFACINGDIDRPVALGTMPNPNHPSPSTEANRWQSVIRTWAQNELTFDDKKGEENIYMHATKDHTVVVRNDESFTVGHDQTTTVDRDQIDRFKRHRVKEVTINETTNVGQNRTESVTVDETITIGNNRSLSVAVNNDVVVGSNESLTVGASRSKTVGASESCLIGASQSVMVGASKSETIGADLTLTVGGNATIGIAGNGKHTANGTQDIASSSDMSISSGSTISITAASEITLGVGGSTIKIDASGITISGPKIASSAQGVQEITGALVKIN